MTGTADQVIDASQRLRRKRIRRLALIFVIIASLWLCHPPVLRGVAGLLIVDQEQADWDYVWLRADDGDQDRYYDRAAKLYHEDTSRRILLIEPYPRRVVQVGAVPAFQAIARHKMEARGVPEDALVTVDGRSKNRWEEARILEAWTSEAPDARVVLLCDRLGSRRWRLILDTVLGTGRIDVLAIPDRRYDEANWWTSRRGVKGLFQAYVALTFAWCQGEDAPEQNLWNPDDYEQWLEQIVREVQ